MSANLPLGVSIPFTDLDDTARQLVETAWDASYKAYVPRSDFPVGSAILAENAAGESRVFRGCNVENDYFSATICGERNAGSTAVAEGFSRFRAVAVVCRKIPGGSPCGLCRQFLNEFGQDAVLYNIVDKDKNVRRAKVGDLLPAGRGVLMPVASLSASDKRHIAALRALQAEAYVPYSKNPMAASFRAANGEGAYKRFFGKTCDNASFGGSIAAELVAMYAARTAGYVHKGVLTVTVPDVHAHNPIEGCALQVLREFGVNQEVMLVDAESVLVTDLCTLLPDSFGPESL